jgi:hypothetical protein
LDGSGVHTDGPDVLFQLFTAEAGVYEYTDFIRFHVYGVAGASAGQYAKPHMYSPFLLFSVVRIAFPGSFHLRSLRKQSKAA